MTRKPMVPSRRASFRWRPFLWVWAATGGRPYFTLDGGQPPCTRSLMMRQPLAVALAFARRCCLWGVDSQLLTQRKIARQQSAPKVDEKRHVETLNHKDDVQRFHAK